LNRDLAHITELVENITLAQDNISLSNARSPKHKHDNYKYHGYSELGLWRTFFLSRFSVW